MTTTSLTNRMGLYGSYFLSTAGIGFTLPYLPLLLAQKGLSDGAIGLVSTLAALGGLAQFPLGVWSDRLGRRKPFLVAALATVAMATALLPRAHTTVGLMVLVILLAENGLGRTIVESLSGAEATALADPDGVGLALGRLRFWKPVGIILVALAGGVLAERQGIASVLGPLAVVQSLAVTAALLIREGHGVTLQGDARGSPRQIPMRGWTDPAIWGFVAAMVLFHVANAPAGIYLGLFLKRGFGAPEWTLAEAFVVSMVTWMLVVRPAGRLADRLGRRPLLLGAWGVMAARLALLALASSARQVVAIQVLDGLANGLFAVVAAAWVTDRLGDARRAGTAQVLVGTSLVLGSALGPALSGLVVVALGYRGLFGLLAGIGLVATALVVLFAPETVTCRTARPALPNRGTTDLATMP